MYMYLGPKRTTTSTDTLEAPKALPDVVLETSSLVSLDENTYVNLICELYENQGDFFRGDDPNFYATKYSNVINPMVRMESSTIQKANNYRELTMPEYAAVVCHWLHRYYSLRTDLDKKSKKEHQKNWTFRKYRLGMSKEPPDSEEFVLRDEWGPGFVTGEGVIGDYGEVFVDKDTGRKINDIPFYDLLEVNPKSFWECCSEYQPELLKYRVKEIALLFECVLVLIYQMTEKRKMNRDLSNESMKATFKNIKQNKELTKMLEPVNVFEFGWHKLNDQEVMILFDCIKTVKVPFSKNIDAFPLSEFSPHDILLTVKRMPKTKDDHAGFFPTPSSATDRLCENDQCVEKAFYHLFYAVMQNVQNDRSAQNIEKAILKIKEQGKVSDTDDRIQDAGVLEERFWSLHHPRSLYTLLGVKQNATREEISRAFRRNGLKFHPDKGGDEEQFKKYGKAHEILTNDSAREIYDQRGDEALHDKKLKERFPQFKVV